MGKAIEKAKPQVALELPAEIVERIVAGGDLSGLSTEQRIAYYNYMCEKNGLDPAGRPFEFIELNKKLTLYARKACTDQLRRIHGVSVVDSKVQQINGMFVCSCTVRNAQGRTDTGIGAVPIGTQPDMAMMKAETKAKRRATLSICGIGDVEETHPTELPMQIENPECKSQILLEDEGKVKRVFREVVLSKITQSMLPAEILVELCLQAKRLAGTESIEEAAKWLQQNADVMVREAEDEEGNIKIYASIKEATNGPQGQ